VRHGISLLGGLLVSRGVGPAGLQRIVEAARRTASQDYCASESRWRSGRHYVPKAQSGYQRSSAPQSGGGGGGGVGWAGPRGGGRVAGSAGGGGAGGRRLSEVAISQAD